MNNTHLRSIYKYSILLTFASPSVLVSGERMASMEACPTSGQYRSIPNDIICEILSHCGGPLWSLRDMAKLCRINRCDWSEVGLVFATLIQLVASDLNCQIRAHTARSSEPLSTRPCQL